MAPGTSTRMLLIPRVNPHHAWGNDLRKIVRNEGPHPEGRRGRTATGDLARPSKRLQPVIVSFLARIIRFRTRTYVYQSGFVFHTAS